MHAVIICQFNSFTKDDGKPLFSVSSAKFNILFRNQGGRGHYIVSISVHLRRGMLAFGDGMP